MSMPVQIVCPNCDASYSVADDHLGKLGRCKMCRAEFPLVPSTRDGAASSPETDLDSAPKAADAALPESFGRYKVLRLLGRGGMGSVYLALDTQLKRQVALKVPHINAFADRPDVRERFFREAQAAARFHHPNFCPIHDIGEVAGVPYLTMAFIEGKTLAASIERDQGWPPRRAAEVTRELALALAEAHREGIVHRDLKPTNIMVDARGRLVLMDFGLARWYDDIDSSFTPTGAILGTPAYMPPEQAEGNLKAIGPRSDLYSLGVILYELLTGRRPFEGPITKVLGMIAFVEPDPPSKHRPDLDPRIEVLCLKAMAKKIDERHASMDEFAGALAAFLIEEVVPVPVVPPQPAEKPARTDFVEVESREPASIGDGKPPLEPKLEGSEDWSPHSRSRSPVLSRMVAAIAFAAVFFGIIYVATDKGRIKIEVNDPNAVVSVDGENIRIEGLGEPITFWAGEHDLSVKRGDVEVETRKFVVRRGDNPVLTINLEPPRPKQPTPATPTPETKKVDLPPDIPKPPDKPKSVVETPKVDDTLITNTLGMKLNLIPAGVFEMGSDASDKDARDDEKVNGKKHQVRITSPFYLGTTEVTVGQFRQFVEMSNNKTESEKDGKLLAFSGQHAAQKSNNKTESEKDGKGGYGWNEAKGAFEQDPKYTWRSPGFPQTDDHPVTNVSWNDAVAFCEWLSKEEGQTYRLPTEAEWEYSCRAGQASRYSSGDDSESLATVGNVADATAKEKYPDWTWAIKARDGYIFTAPVGRFLPNGFGLYDMHGNVWEWCSDYYDSKYYSVSPAADPLNSAQAAGRVSRGGSWFDFPRDCRSADRGRGTPGIRPDYLGFRVVRVRPER